MIAGLGAELASDHDWESDAVELVGGEYREGNSIVMVHDAPDSIVVAEPSTVADPNLEVPRFDLTHPAYDPEGETADYRQYTLMDRPDSEEGSQSLEQKMVGAKEQEGELVSSDRKYHPGESD